LALARFRRGSPAAIFTDGNPFSKLTFVIMPNTPRASNPINKFDVRQFCRGRERLSLRQYVAHSCDLLPRCRFCRSSSRIVNANPHDARKA
jgi:hypothetical protein